jgi:acetyl-CoA carboxylase carboxyltransferase component
LDVLILCRHRSAPKEIELAINEIRTNQRRTSFVNWKSLRQFSPQTTLAGSLVLRLGVYRTEEVGPMGVQVPNGVVDIAVQDEAEAVIVAKKYLSYFQGAIETWEAPDQRFLRFVVPENRLRYYNMQDVLHGIADVDSVLELRPQWGVAIIMAFIRVEGRPVGVIANNPGHLAGAIDADGADKAARFMQLCDAFDLPILSLCDCPGMMVGPEF